VTAEAELGSVDLDAVDPVRTLRLADIPEVAPEQRWLVEGLWPSEGVGVVAATAKVGKTWIAADIGISVASATPFAGHFPVQRAGRVIMFASEDRNHEMKTRVLGLARARNLPLQDLAFELVDEPMLTLNRPMDLGRLERRLRDDRPALVILDPLRRVCSGHESSSDAMSLVLTQFRRIQRQYSVAILLTHHITKQSEHDPVSGHSLRGSSDIHAWGDVNLYVWRSRDDESISIVRGEYRNSPPQPPFLLRRVLGADPTGIPSTHIEYMPGDPATVGATAANSETADLQERLLAVLSEAQHGLGFNALRSQLGVGAEKVSALLKELEQAGLVAKVGRVWTSRSVPPAP